MLSSSPISTLFVCCNSAYWILDAKILQPIACRLDDVFACSNEGLSMKTSQSNSYYTRSVAIALWEGCSGPSSGKGGVSTPSKFLLHLNKHKHGAGMKRATSQFLMRSMITN
jgi:hypothetical protein